MAKHYCEMKLKEKIYSEKNIYMALYSVDSYIMNKELLDENDSMELNKLRDKFDEVNISKWISRIQTRLKELIDENDYLYASVYFKPKKYDETTQEIVFRPLHSASLEDQITAVSLLNILIYEFDEKNKMSMSNLSRLIPHNFYGNRVSYEPELLFKPWKEQYKQYTGQANELYRKYRENGEYKWEVDLDLENFFPSVNPICLYNYIMQQVSVAYSDDERELIAKILQKLIFVKLRKLSKKELYYYTRNENVRDCEFALGIPQGMPQGYFLANLYMVEIEKIYKKILPGDMLFYVDDSVIFTNEINNITDFAQKINKINDEIHNWNRKLYNESIRGLDDKITEFIKRNNTLFGINIHEPGEKSTISNIKDSKEGEAYIHCVGRETSKTAFEINTSYSDEESKILFNKTACILSAIELELEKVNKELESDSLNDDEKKYKNAYKKKLIRYKKFFKYRNADLGYRGKSDSSELEEALLKDLEFLDIENKEEGWKEFFNKYNEDILGTTISFVLKSMKDLGKNYSGIVNKIKELNVQLFGTGNEQTSYIYKVYEKYVSNGNVEMTDIIEEYRYLKKIVNEKKMSTVKKTDRIRTDLVFEELKLVDLGPLDYIKGYMSMEFVNCIELVVANSENLYRKLLNAILSHLCQIEIGEEVVLQKKGNRKITYMELRMLQFLRNKHFSQVQFRAKVEDFIQDEYQYAIDYSILQVLNIFKTFVSNPIYVDNLILVHKYTCDIWKNGSKYLYFYTLHNQEHAVDLIRNSIKVIRAIDYIDISTNDYYVLFMACYLHDISMVTFPDLDKFQSDIYDSNKIYSDFVEKIRNEQKESCLAMNPVKQLLKDVYIKMDVFYENLVRDSHARNSAYEIRKRNDLEFIDKSIREIVAEVSEAHGYDVAEIYKIKSTASSKLWSQKFTKIVLRLADLLDMSNYRVSQLVLNHNLDNMGEVSRFHWLSHLVTRGYEVTTNYELKDNLDDMFLKKGSIKEKIIFTITVDLPQFTKEKNGNCKYMELRDVRDNIIELNCGSACDSEKCNFLCKWFALKNKYLFSELSALTEYLNSLPDNYFTPEIKVVIKTTNTNCLSTKQFTLLKNYVESREIF